MVMLRQYGWTATIVIDETNAHVLRYGYCSAFASLAEDKGTCPLAPLHEKHRTNSADRSGKIQLLAVVSDTVYVCSAKVIDGIDKKSDADAENAVRQWHFVPAKKNGSPVPVVITVEVRYVRDKDGNVVLSSHQPAPTKDAPHH